MTGWLTLLIIFTTIFYYSFEDIDKKFLMASIFVFSLFVSIIMTLSASTNSIYSAYEIATHQADMHAARHMYGRLLTFYSLTLASFARLIIRHTR